MRYLLDENKKPYPVSIEESFKLYDDLDMKIVKSEYLDNENVRVSTVFLGYNAAYYGAEDKPLFFETMVFGGAYDDYMVRYETYQEAVDGHNEIVNKIKSKLNASL
jgi:hypothetical protein